MSCVLAFDKALIAIQCDGTSENGANLYSEHVEFANCVAAGQKKQLHVCLAGAYLAWRDFWH